jgi:hypothetical protein
LDEEGCAAAEQHGIYGMGAWIALTVDREDDSIRYLPGIKEMCDSCREELTRLVRKAQGNSEDDKARALRIVVPKICYCYIGLVPYPDSTAETDELWRWIASSQRPDGSWGYLTESKSGCPEVTSLVVRTFEKQPALAQNIKEAVVYLRGKYSSVDNLFLRLYTLNTLLRFDNQLNSPDYRKIIKKVIRKLLNQAFFNPTRFPNPINLDFNDGKKTRYIRLSTDVILLESLELISGPRKLYARGHPGRRVYLHVIQTFREPPTKDTTGHRLSPFSALHLRRSLKPFLAAKESPGLLRLAEKTWAYLVCAWSFGVNLEWNLISLIICIAGIVVSIRYGITLLKGPFIGAGIKAALDVCKSLYNAWTRFANE